MSAQPKPQSKSGGPPEPRRGGPKKGRRTAARIAAVQALYQIDMSRADPGAVITEFRDHRLGQGGQSGGKGRGAPDAAHFADVVARAAVRRDEIDALIRPALAEGWALERLDAVMRALLRAGVAELMEEGTPARVVIDEYVQVAHAFFAAREAGFANGILHRLAQRLRSAELASAPEGGGADGGRQTER